MDFLSILFFIIALIVIYLVYMSWNFRTFTKQGIPMSVTPIPIFGTLLAGFKDGPVALYEGTLASKGKTFGDFNGRQPVLTTVDTDLIRTVFIKEHFSFPHRFSILTGNTINDMMLSNIEDYDHWKFMRTVMSPTFSSGKLKRMMMQINKCAKQMKENLIKNCKDNKSVELKDYSGSFTMDVIASTAFGLDINTKEDHNNPFVVYGRKAFNLSPFHPAIIFRIFFPFLMPVLQLLAIPFFDKDVVRFFTDVTKKTIEARKGDTSGADFLSLLLIAHKEEEEENDLKAHGIKAEIPKRALKEEEIIAQSLLFFLAGYDTTATSIAFLAYNLACNQDKQDKLIEEIDSVIGNNENISDQDLHNMPYLEQCVNESLRLYPPAMLIDRQATKDFDLKGIHLPKDALVRVPIYHMHRHEEFYPKPNDFIPERFSQEEKNKRDPLLFMPFGAGPRQCIAMRLALTEIKISISQVLKTHKFVKAPETEVPVKLDKMGLLKAVNGIWARVVERE